MLDLQNYIGGLINLNLSAKRLNGSIDQGSGTFVYYSFVDTEETIGTSFSSMSAVQRENTRLALNVYEKSSGLRFAELTDEMEEAGLAPQVSFRLNDMSPAGNAGTPFVTDTTVLTKYVTISDRADAMNEGSFYYGVLLHEIGHASGMRHPNIPDAYDHTDYTIMSYNGPIASTDIKIMDKFALQTHYGTSADMDHITYWQDGLNFMAQGDETNNRFIGVTGPNNIKGMGGNDLLGGRLGADTFILSDGTQRTKEIDHIYYYAKGEDTIEVTFVGLPVLIAKYQDENLHVTVGNTTTVIQDASWSDVTWDFQWA